MEECLEGLDKDVMDNVLVTDRLNGFREELVTLMIVRYIVQNCCRVGQYLVEVLKLGLIPMLWRICSDYSSLQISKF